MYRGMQTMSHFADQRIRMYMETAAGPGALEAPEKRVRRHRRRR